MIQINNPKSQISDVPEPLPLSLLNDFLYCPRRAALKAIEGHREENEHTIRGDIAHEHADLPGYEVAKGVTLLRALPVWSERLGRSGKCDIVEFEMGSARNSFPSNTRKANAGSLRTTTRNSAPRRFVSKKCLASWLTAVLSFTPPASAGARSSSRRNCGS